MTIECRCPGCGGRFRAADEAAGRLVKCPQCDSAITVPEAAARPPASPPFAKKRSSPSRPATPAVPPGPAMAEPAWFVRTADDRQHGPLAKGQLDQLVAQGRLDAFCELRRADWEAWQAVDEVYPSLAMQDDERHFVASPDPSDSATRAAAGQSSRVRPCPDCGQTVSRRAAKCPHCGCPLTGESPERVPGQPPPVPSTVPETDVEPTGAGGRFVRLLAILGTAIVLLVAVVGAGIYLGVLIGNRMNPPAPPVVIVPSPPASAPVTPPTAAALNAERIAKCKDEVAAAMAREVDDANRAKHELTAALPQLGQYAEALKMAQEMADPRSDPLKEEEKPQTPKQKPEPYQSQFEVFRRECRAYLDAHVHEPVEREEAIWSVGRQWVKMRLPEQSLLENLLQPEAKPPETR